MSNNTIEDHSISTNVREIVKIIMLTLAGAGAWYNLKTDIREYASENKLDKKLMEVRITGVELRLTQIENELKEQKKQDEAELKKQLEQKNEIVYK